MGNPPGEPPLKGSFNKKTTPILKSLLPLNDGRTIIPFEADIIHLAKNEGYMEKDEKIG